jgi:hypothetical protein
MMFIRLLVLLGTLVTLAMAGTPASSTRSPTKEKTMSPKAPKPPKASKSKSKPTPPKVCGPPYDKGCPCFNKRDVNTLLALAADVAGSEDYCFYKELNFTDYYQWVLKAEIRTESSVTTRSLTVGVLAANQTDDQDLLDACVNDYFFDNYLTRSVLDDDYEIWDYFATVLEGSVATTCADLIKDVKDQMMALNCTVSEEEQSNQN